MAYRRDYQTTTAAQFREIAMAAQSSGRLAELIAAIRERLERQQTMLELHEATRDFQQIRETKKSIANLESKLEIAKRLERKKVSNG
jgi:hypothetical protein